MIFQPKHDYLLIIAVFILLLSAIGVMVLHLGGASPTGEVIYHPCHGLYLEYLENHCDVMPGHPACIQILQEKERTMC